MVNGIEATQKALDNALTTEHIQPGTTRELDVAELLDKAARAVEAKVLFAHVMVGPCRGHSEATERVIQPGDLLRIDYGIDFKGYSSDIQRTAYVRKPGEVGPPEAVVRLFETTLKACRAGIDALQPGKRGQDVDRAARAVITGAGYEEYPHASGHAIGVETHELGPILGPPWRERYGTAVEHVIEPGMVYAVEPAAYVDIPECGGLVHVGLEEDVEVTNDGPKIIGTPQTELIVIKS
jgi:Xaa-Pro aminopeptidase